MRVDLFANVAVAAQQFLGALKIESRVAAQVRGEARKDFVIAQRRKRGVLGKPIGLSNHNQHLGVNARHLGQANRVNVLRRKRGGGLLLQSKRVPLLSIGQSRAGNVVAALRHVCIANEVAHGHHGRQNFFNRLVRALQQLRAHLWRHVGVLAQKRSA